MKSLPFTHHVALTVHRVLAQHGPWEFCPECPYVVCRHCRDIGKPGNDHTCPCPYSDEDCQNHRKSDTGGTPNE